MKLKTLTATTAAHADLAENILRTCVHCGLCNATCPTYQLLHNECDGPRGRIYLIKQVLEGESLGVQTLEHLDRCLTCRACETTCPSGVQYARLLDIGRQQLEQQVKRSWLNRLKRAAFCYVLPYPQRFAPLVTVARFFRLPFVPPKPAVMHYRPKIQTRKMLLLTGCVQDSLAPTINLATASVLEQLGISVLHGSGCCGAISQHNSAPEQALQFAKRNIDAWLPYLEQGVETIISTASGCGVMVKEYGDLLQHDAAYADKARRVSAATKDLLEVLLAEDVDCLRTKEKLTIAVQTPCTLQHGQKLVGKLEQLLGDLGFQLCAVNDSHLCCGSAGTYALLQPKIAQQLAVNKIHNLEQTQPDIIATANIGCLTHLQKYANTPIKHWIEIVAECHALRDHHAERDAPR